MTVKIQRNVIKEEFKRVTIELKKIIVNHR